MIARATAALALIAAACSGRGAPAATDEATPAAAVQCIAAVTQPVAETVVVRGVVAPPPRADAWLSTTVAGRVTELRVEVGDHVTAGQIVARVEDPALPAGAQESLAVIAAAQADVGGAVATRARLEKLVAGGIAARRDLDDAIAREGVARADLAAARARGTAASGQAARAALRSPITGTVLRIFRRAGEAVDGTPATPVLEVADVSALELRADVPAAELIRLRAGDVAAVAFDALPRVTSIATVVAVAPAVDPATALGPVRLGLTAVDGAPRVLVGLSGAATIALAPHDGVVVPTAALRRGMTGADEVVVCAGAPLAAAVRAVTIGARLGDTTELLDGLAAGERVVVDRALGLTDGQPLVEARAP